ncbi:MAG: ABC transporter ATP-binding protein [Anaerofustis sp.]
MEKNIIEVKNLTKEFDSEVVVNHINFTIAEREFVTLLGPSGCGKTTILRMIAGFEKPTEGEILFYDRVINDIPSYKREVNTVFQNYALFPHMNVYENVAFSLNLKKTKKEIVREQVTELLKIVNLAGFEKRDVSSLSGGQQQRVAIARALANEPKVLLLDEPLSALDLKLRKEMQVELKRIQQRVNITFVYVTHDQEEALSLSDKIIVMRSGEIQQQGTPTDIYNEPVNRYVADFIGESNILDGEMERDFEVSFLGKTFACVDPRFPEDTRVRVVIRPEDLAFCPADGAKLTVDIRSVLFKGVHYEYIADHDGVSFMIHSTDFVEVGKRIGLDFDPDDIHIMRYEE